MTKFNSPLGSKTIPGGKLREFDIPDDSGGGNDDHPLMPAPKREIAMDINAIQAFQDRLRNSEPDQELERSAAIERDIKRARDDRRAGRERIGEGAKRRIEMLIEMTRSTREVEIEGNSFVFQTLKSREMREAIMAVSQFDGTVQGAFEMRRQFLARSLTHISGIEFEQFIGSRDLEDKLDFVDQFDEPLLNRLYSEYLELVKEAKSKYAIKTEADVKEVASDLKK